MDRGLLLCSILGLCFATSAAGSMVTDGPHFLVVDNGVFSVHIEKATGKIKHAFIDGRPDRFDLATDYPTHALFFPEFAVMRTDSVSDFYIPDRYDTQVTVKLQADTPEVAIVSVVWHSEWADVLWTFRFPAGVPFFVAYTERRILKDGVFTNAQQDVMVTPQMDDSYVVDYEGHWLPTMVNRFFPRRGDLVNSEFSLFSAIDQGIGTRFPGVAWHSDARDVTVGVLATSVTPNQHETISGLGGGRSIRDLGGFGEFQFNWFGKSDSESILLRENTVYGMEQYYYLNGGSADGFDGFNTALFNERRYDLERPENYVVASWGGRRQASSTLSWNYPQASSIYYNTQELARNRAVSIPRSQNGTRDTHIVDLDVKALLGGTGSVVDLAPIEPERITHSTSATRQAGGRMEGEMTWIVSGLENTLRLIAYEDSDKLTVEGSVKAVRWVSVEEIWVDLAYSPRVTQTARFRNGDGMDIRCEDAVYGTIGLAVYSTSGITAMVDTVSSVRLYLLRRGSAVRLLPGEEYAYKFVFYPHLGRSIAAAEEIPPFHTAEDRYCRDYYKTLPGFETYSGLGIKASRHAAAVSAAMREDSGRYLSITLATDPGRYPLRFFLEDQVFDRVLCNGIELPGSNWSVDRASGVVSIETDWPAPVARIEFANIATLADESPRSHASQATDVAGRRWTSGGSFPNPFNGSTTIRCSRVAGSVRGATSSNVVIAISSLSGKRVRSLRAGVSSVSGSPGLAAGQSRIPATWTSAVVWDGTDDDGLPLPSGVYVCRALFDGLMDHPSWKTVLLR